MTDTCMFLPEEQIPPHTQPNARPKLTSFYLSPLLLTSSGSLRIRKQQYGFPNYRNLLYNDNPWSNLACTMRVVVLAQMEDLINSL